MQQFLKKHRWAILAAGAVIQIFTGIPAAWGVFQKPICETFAMNEGAASMIFALTVAFFGIGCILGGYLQDARGPRVAGVAGTVLLAAGFALSALVPDQAGWLLTLSFSVPAGLGSAFLYPSVMSCAQKWYADRKGVATGVIGGAVGLSGAVLTLLGRGMQNQFGLRGCFLGFAVLVAICCGGACVLLADPPQTKTQKTKGRDYIPQQMFKTRQYWLVLSVVTLGTPAVLLFSPVIVELGQSRGLSGNVALLSIIVGSVGSAAGRLLMPALSDKTGRRAVDLGLFAGLAVLSFAFIFANGWLVILGYSALTFCYSGECALLPALGTDLFGIKNAGRNYGFLAIGQSIGSVSFSLLANSFDAVGPRHIIGIIASAAGFIVLLFLKPTSGKKI